MLKVAMLAPEFLNVWGGVGSYITELVMNLPKSIEVHVLTPYRESFGKGDKNVTDHVELSDNIRVHYVTLAKDTFFYNARFQYAVYNSVPSLIKREGIDILHSHTAHMPDVLLRLFNRIEVPVVTTIHTTIKSQYAATRSSGIGFSGMSQSERMTSLLYLVLRIIEELYLRKGEVYVTPSNYMKKWLEREYPYLHGKIKVVYNAVDTEFWRKSDKGYDLKSETGFENIVLYVGRLLALKGVYDLVKTIPRILRDNKETIFIFCGTGERRQIELMLRKLGIPEKNYMFVGYLPRHELIKLYSTSSVLTLPSYGENLPMTLLEAMSCSLPVIASNVGGVPEVVQHMVNGLVIDPGDLNALSNSIIMLLQDKNLRKKLAHSARKTIEERFSWNRIIPQIIHTYQEALKSKRG
ncbi:MAG: glycosyltransferase family 4 protein [Candidatus Korarchaeota archaeon]